METENKTPHPRSFHGVAQRNGVCVATLYNEIKRGSLEYTKLGGRSIITEAQEAEWLERGRVAAKQQTAA